MKNSKVKVKRKIESSTKPTVEPMVEPKVEAVLTPSVPTLNDDQVVQSQPPVKMETKIEDKNAMRPNKFLTYGRTKLVKGTILVPEMGNLRLILVPGREDGKPEGELYNLLDKKWKNTKRKFTIQVSL